MTGCNSLIFWSWWGIIHVYLMKLYFSDRSKIFTLLYSTVVGKVGKIWSTISFGILAHKMNYRSTGIIKKVSSPERSHMILSFKKMIINFSNRSQWYVHFSRAYVMTTHNGQSMIVHECIRYEVTVIKPMVVGLSTNNDDNNDYDDTGYMTRRIW